MNDLPNGRCSACGAQLNAHLMPETALRAALAEAVKIAKGSGAEFRWDVVERLNELQRIAEE